MENFKSFITENEDYLLTEALNNPVAYYMTDDTKIPESVYAAFNVDGDNYIMSLVQTEDTGIYLFEVGKTSSNGGKTLWWRFHNKKHMLPVMATAMNFLQAATAWIQGKIKGIAIHFKMGAAANAARAQRIAEKIIKRSYVKSFNVVPVSQPPLEDKDKYYYQKMRYVFIAKKGVAASTLFGGKTFKKYDLEAGVAPIEAVSQLQPKKVKKATNTIKPSKKYSFGEFDVETPDNEELIDKVMNIKIVDSSDQKDIEKSAPQDYNDMLSVASGGSKNSKSGMLKALPSMQSMVNALEKNGFDESKLNWGNLEYIINNQSSPAEKALLKNADLIPVSSSQDNWREIMQKVATPSPSNTIKQIVKWGKQSAEEFMAKYPQGDIYDKSSTPTSGTVIKSNIDPAELQATLPGSGTEVTIDGTKFQVKGEDPLTKTNHLMNNLGYDKKITTASGWQQLYSYTGSSYNSYNTPLRTIVQQLLEQQNVDKGLVKQVVSSTGKYKKLASMFDKVDPLPESLWVYRGTFLPENLKQTIAPGYQFVDPAYLSTSVKPSVSFGKDRMRIFLPKGSKVLPVLGNSKHASEQEILLPPASVIKVIEVEKMSSKVFFQGIYVGSSWKSIFSALENKLNESTNYSTINSIKLIIENMRLMEQQENEKYNPEDKFGGAYNEELAELINQEIKKGNLEIERPKTSDDD